MSGVDNLLGLDWLDCSGRLGEENLVLLFATDTGYTWAATLIRWGSAQ
jgi:3-oxoacyl-[acyl-carrier-protein] synthase-3